MGIYTELSCFSGYGGFGLGLKLAGIPTRTICYIENDDYCQRILQARIRDGFLDDAPIWDDIKTFDGTPWAGQVDILTAGFPCQPHSNAGKRLGKEDSRNLWPDTLDVIRVVGPRYVLLENVRGLVDGANPYSAEVIGSLSEAGYNAVWGLHSAAEAGAPHLRWRWWCLAYLDNSAKSRCKTQRVRTIRPGQGLTIGGSGQEGDVADAEVQRTGDERKDIRQASGEVNTPKYPSGSIGRDDRPHNGKDVAGTYSESHRERRLHGEPEEYPTEGGSESFSNLASVDREDVAYSERKGLEGGTRQDVGTHRDSRFGRNDWWETEPNVGRVVDGCPHRVDRLRTLGNGIVPSVVVEFLREGLTD